MDADAAAARLLGEAIIEQSPRQESPSPRLLLMALISTQKKEEEEILQRWRLLASFAASWPSSS